MSYDDEQTKKSRVVVETPTARREVVRTETARVPDRRGMSSGVVAALVIGAVALVTILFLFLMNRQTEDTTNANVTLASQPTPLPQTTIIEQAPPQQQPPIIIQQPAPAAQSAPIIVTQPAPNSGESRPSGPDDSTIQSNIQKRFSDDQTLNSLGLTAMVIDGKVTLTGTVKTEALKRQIEKLVREVRGVRGIDNQILVMG
ncbi:MAG: BON domain-containing protein [Pyrinomonadaceae bacterium]